MQNRQWLINGNPRGRAIELNDFRESSVELGVLGEDQVRVRTEWLSFDPSQKAQLENVSGYAKGNELGDVMYARGIGEVVESTSADIAVGAKVMGHLGWQEFADLPGRVVEVVADDAFLSARLGILGTTGLTAYFGLLRIGKPEPGDTVLTSGAAGAVGSVVGQIARIMGCETIGIAGGAAKCEWLTGELGFDAAIDYKAERVKRRLSELCPGGVNVFFDNVGGEALNDALARIASHARIVICGGIARYEEAKPAGPTNYFNIVFRQAVMEGFLLSGYERDYEVARERLQGWIESGQILHREDVQQGFDNIPATLMRLFSGANMGKQLLKLT
jgi:NADPH-dependent curcumin reductase CurA